MDESTRNLDHLGDTVRVVQQDVGTAELTYIDSIPLRTAMPSPAELAPDISDIVLRKRKWYVFDYTSKKVMVFDSAGTLTTTVGAANDAEPIVSPRRVAFAADTMLIVDLGSTRHVRAFTEDGREVPFAQLPNAAEISDLALGDHGILAAVRASARLKFRERAVFVRANRDSVTATCAADRRYLEARKGSTLLSSVFTTLGVGYEGKIACVQGLSPVVTVFDPASGQSTYSTRMPPQYRPPEDRSMDMNAKTMSAYQASWTQHVLAYPTNKGVLSVYDLPRDSAGRHFLLFQCDSTSGKVTCGQNTVHGRTVRFISPDTLVVARGSRGISLVRFHVRRWY